ncbi:hypothetical protein AB8B12_03435 [Streptomyces sp. PGLac3x]
MAIDGAERLLEVAAFALFGDVARDNDVHDEVRRRYGSRARSLIRQCQKGAHPGGASILDPHGFITEIAELAQDIRKAGRTA